MRRGYGVRPRPRPARLRMLVEYGPLRKTCDVARGTVRPYSVVAPPAGGDGYGQSAEQLILAARKLGADVEFVSYDWRDSRYSDADLVASESPVVTRDTVVLHFLPFIVARFNA